MNNHQSNKLEIDGCFSLSGELKTDSRGWLIKPYSSLDGALGWLQDQPVAEVFWSQSSRGVFRGMHLQLPPNAVSKAVFCVSGSIVDFVLDLRSDSRTYLQTLEMTLSPGSDSNSGLVIPKGCAHGFFATSTQAIVMYLQSGPRVEESESGVHFSVLGAENMLKAGELIVSERDRGLGTLNSVPQFTSFEWEQND